MVTRSKSKKTRQSKTQVKKTTKKQSKAATPKQKVTVKKASESALKTPSHIVGIGASAGGLEAIESFFKNMPSDTGLAFVIVQHLSPDFKSLMEELMTRYTAMNIHRVEEGMRVEANSVYLIPPKKEMIIENGKLRLRDREPTQNLNLPIDIFFNSLAEDKKDKAIAVVLSGTGSDGSRGIKSIHDNGGLVIVQDEASAKFDSMPKSALSTGLVDFTLAPEEMPEILVLYEQKLLKPEDVEEKHKIVHSEKYKYHEICTTLMKKYGIDFTYYKPTTVGRRIERRMSINRSMYFDEYVKLVNRNSEELEALYKDLLIGVTKFFRDKEAFDVIKEKIIPEMISDSDNTDEIRVWIPGCATGEEAYSIAILFYEHMQKLGRSNNIRIFATDVHKFSLEKAAEGIFQEDSLENLSEDYRRQYFQKNQEGYKIVSEIRKMVVFAEHNVIKDPPFTKIDLISCRNLLIYLQPVAQKKVLSLFHFSLRTGGALFLGPSETLGSLDNEFILIDKHWKISKKRRDIRLKDETQLAHLAIGGVNRIPIPSEVKKGPHEELRISRAYEKLLQEYVPPSILIDENRKVVHTFGNARDYLKPPTGKIDLDILSMVDGDLRIAISTAIQRSKKEGKEVTYKGIRYNLAGTSKNIQVIVRPLSDKISDVNYHLVILEDIIRKPESPADQTDEQKEFKPGPEAKARIIELEEELQYSKEHLQATVEELETSNEELQATNEELLASNEELQSTNEELHSVNEELYTVNGEYERKIEELVQLNNDIDNLLKSTEIGTMFLDRNLRIRKYTPAITYTYNLMPHDIDRPLEHLASKIESQDDLLAVAQNVLDTGKVSEIDVKTIDGTWYLQRILPYRDSNNKIDGVVVTYIDINDTWLAYEQLKESQSRLTMALGAIDAGIWMWNFSDDTIVWDERMEEMFGYEVGTFPGNYNGFKCKIHPDDIETTEKAIELAQKGKKKYDVIYRAKKLKKKDWSYIHAISITLRNDEGKPTGMIGLCHDVTEQVIRQRNLESALESLDAKNKFIESVLNATPDAIYIYDIKKNKNVYANKYITDILGYSPAEVKEIGDQALQSLMHEDDYDDYVNSIIPQYATATKNDIITNKFRMKHKKGNWVWLDCREVIYSRNDDGSPKEILGMTHDITSATQLADELNVVLKTTADGFLISDTKGKILEVNEAYCKIVGYTKQELLSMSAFDLESKETARKTKERIKKTIKSGYDRFVTKHSCKDGAIKDIDISINYLDIDNGKFYMFLRDVTEQKEAEFLVIDEREKLLAMFDSLEDFVYVCDPETHEILYANDILIKEFGKDLIGKKCYKAIQGETKPCSFCSNDIIFNQKPDEPYFWELQNKKNGRWYRCVDKAIQWTSNKLVRFEMASDITEKVQALEQLQRQTIDLKKANADLEQFAYFISHDLKEPLRSISGFCQLIYKKYIGELDEKGEKYLNMVINSSENLSSMIDLILDFSRISREKIKVVNIDSKKLLNQVIASLAGPIRETETEITFDNIEEFCGDRGQMGRLFQNLITNSIKYSGKSKPQISISIDTNDDTYSITVKDNGIGFDKKQADTIFLPFKRLRQHKDIDGHGMGLTICRKIVDLHHGKIWAESAKGKGTTINISIPREDTIHA